MEEGLKRNKGREDLEERLERGRTEGRVCQGKKGREKKGLRGRREERRRA